MDHPIKWATNFPNETYMYVYAPPELGIAEPNSA
jgi:hypothetical protein